MFAICLWLGLFATPVDNNQGFVFRPVFAEGLQVTYRADFSLAIKKNQVDNKFFEWAWTFDFSSKIEAVQEDGSFYSTVVLDRFQPTKNQMPMPFDQLKGLIGVPLKVMAAADGEILEVQPPEDLPRAKEFAFAEWRKMLMSNFLLLRYSKKPLRQGESWTFQRLMKVISTQFETSDMYSDCSATYVKDTVFEGQACREVTFRCDLEATNSKGTANYEGYSEGRMWLRDSDLVPVQTHLHAKTEGVEILPDGEEKIELDVDIKVRLLPDGGIQ